MATISFILFFVLVLWSYNAEQKNRWRKEYRSHGSIIGKPIFGGFSEEFKKQFKENWDKNTKEQ